MSDSIYQPYTYILGWSNQNTYYYGVRYGKNCNPNDLWVSYFTSSKYVKEHVNKYGNPDIIQIRKCFTDSGKAQEWEHKVLKRLLVIKRKDFLNETDNESISPVCASVGGSKPKSLLTRQRMSLYHTGKKRPKKMCESISRSKKGVTLCDEARSNRKITMNNPVVKEKLSEIGKTKIGDLNNFYGKSHSEETKKIISEKKKGSTPSNRKQVIIDGVEYESIKSAHIATGISKYLIRKLCKYTIL